MKTCTTWNEKVCINSIFKINSEGKIIKFYLNTFGLSGGKPKLWKINNETEDELKEWIGLINEYLDSENEDRKEIVKHNTRCKKK